MYRRPRYRRRKRVRYTPGYSRVGGSYGRYTVTRERKWLDDGHFVAALSATTPDVNTWDSINHVASGTGPNNRVGEEIWIHSLDIRGQWRMIPAAAASYDNNGSTVRMMIVMDTQSNGTTATVADVLAHATVPTTLSFRNIDGTQRFVILMDKIMTANTMAGHGNGTTNRYAAVTKFFKIHKTFKKPIKVKFNGTTGVQSEIQSNSLMMMFISGESPTDINNEVYIQSRIRFTD